MDTKIIIVLILVCLFFISGCAEQSGQVGIKETDELNLELNPDAPWTGVWAIKTNTAQMYTNKYTLRLRQIGNIVKSVKGSDFTFNGKVVGNRLMGLFFDDEIPMRHDIDVMISNDLKSFEGKDLRQRVITVPITGVRQ